jgi:hypothetical protein
MSRAACLFGIAALLTWSVRCILCAWRDYTVSASCVHGLVALMVDAPTRALGTFAIGAMALLVSLLILCLATCIDRTCYRQYVPPHVLHVTDDRQRFLPGDGEPCDRTDSGNDVCWKHAQVNHVSVYTSCCRGTVVLVLMLSSVLVCIISSFLVCDGMRHVLHLLWQQTLVFAIACLWCVVFGVLVRLGALVCASSTESSLLKPSTGVGRRLRRPIRRHIQVTGSYIMAILIFVAVQLMVPSMRTEAQSFNQSSVVVLFLWTQLTITISFVRMMQAEEARVQCLERDIHTVCLEMDLNATRTGLLQATHPHLLLPWIPLGVILFTCVFRSIAIHAIVVYCRCLKRRFPILSDA